MTTQSNLVLIDLIKQRTTSETVRRIVGDALRDGILRGLLGGHVYFLHFEELAAVKRCVWQEHTDKPVRVDCVPVGQAPPLRDWIDAQIRQTNATQVAIVISVQAVVQGPFAPLMCGVFDLPF